MTEIPLEYTETALQTRLHAAMEGESDEGLSGPLKTKFGWVIMISMFSSRVGAMPKRE